MAYLLRSKAGDLVMMYLSVRSQNPEEAVLEVHGWLSGPNVALLNEELKERAPACRRIVLNLDHLVSIDQMGLGLLRHWCTAGLVLEGGSRFIRMLLDIDSASESEARV